MTLRQGVNPLTSSAGNQIGRLPGKPRAVISHPGFYHGTVTVQPSDGNVGCLTNAMTTLSKLDRRC